MAPEQKQAWLIVIIYAVLFICMGLFFPLLGPIAGFVMIVLVLLSVLIMVILLYLFRKKRVPNEVFEDERDKTIAKQATLAGAMLSYGYFILACCIPFGIYQCRGEEMIPIRVLPSIAGAGVIVFFLARAIGILILYGRGKGSNVG